VIALMLQLADTKFLGLSPGWPSIDMHSR